MAIEAQVRKWGNSLGVIFPKEFVKKRHLEVNEIVVLEVVKEADLETLFGTLKRKKSGQDFKDMVKEGWK